jgi:hypothetical protein
MLAHWKRSRSIYPDLTTVIDAWDRGPDGVRQPIVMLVKAADREAASGS